MPIDPRISLGVQPIQLADPVARYSQIASIQNAQQTNQLQQMQMREAEATAQERNALRQLDPSSENYEAQLFKLNPQLGIAYRKERAAAEASGAAAKASKTTAAKNKQDMLGQAYRDISSRPSDANITAHMEDVLASPLYDDNEKASIKASAAQLLAMPFEERQMFLAQQGAKPSDLKPTVQAVNRSGQTDLLRVPAFGGAPNTVGTYADVPLPPAVLEQKKDIARSGASNIGFKQEAAFEGGLGKGQSERILANQVVAQDAAAILETNQVGRDLLKSGAITGTGADFFVGFNNALKQAGIDFGYADAAANSQAYAAAMGANVGRIIKQFGAGTGLSDADRDYAAQMAGGKINLTEAALRKILDINDKAANRVIDLHNRNVSGVKTNIPLTVDKPTFTQPKSAVDQIPGQSRSAPVAVPQAAIDALKAGKGTDAQFDAIFGAGAAKRARGGK